MRRRLVSSVCFSATGTTRTIMDALAGAFPGDRRMIDLFAGPLDGPLCFGADDLVLAGLPVYGGRLPQIGADRLSFLKGAGTPAIAFVSYGNRDYDDALLELSDMLEAQGFKLVGAAAFVARHSIFPMIATDRPDKDDLRRVRAFGAKCAQKLGADPAMGNAAPLTVKGNFPYKEIALKVPKPSPDERCDLCGVCGDICPTDAITIKGAFAKDDGLCIACAACIFACPAEAQAFRGPAYEAAAKMFVEKFSRRREVEVFL